MQVFTINGRGKVRVNKNVNSHPFISLSIPVNYNKTANINVKKLQFNQVLTATCIEWHTENGDITQHHIDA